MSNNNTPQEFETILASYGFNITTPINPDGKFHRFHERGGKAGNLDGYYRYVDGQIPFAIFGSWRTGCQYRWYAGDRTKLTSADRRELKQIETEAAKRAEAIKIERQHYASWRGQKIWAKAQPADPMHPYLVRKGVRSFGLRQKGDNLVIPFYADGKLTTLQFIHPDGTKRWLSCGKKKTACYRLGMPSDTVCIAEGYATGASIYQAKGYATFIAGDAGNLRWVAEVVRHALPHAKIIICADNDDATSGNPGVKKATEAAAAVGGLLAIAGDYDA
ncbi:MAG: toprim domain-containing protein [Rickettsiales bacterium]